MKKIDIMIAVCASAVLIIALFVPINHVSSEENKTLNKSPMSHTPISINGNSNFTEENGVGNPLATGTEDDPYIIENWDINASTAHGIYIENTNVYFIIKNCTVQNGTRNNYGVYFYNVTNGKIDNISSHNNDYGIYFVSSSNSSIINCTVYSSNDVSMYFEESNNNSVTNCGVYNTDIAIYFVRCSGNVIASCILHNNTGEDNIGVYFDGSNNNCITNCEMYDNAYGVLFEASSYNNITKCDCYNNNYGIFFDSSTNNNQITECLLHNNNYSIYLYDSPEGNQITDSTLYNNSNYAIYVTEITAAIVNVKNRVYHNNFINNNNAYDDSDSTVWDNGYHFGGNYWNNYTGIDADGDGIGDSYFNLSGKTPPNQDHYPFINPIEYVPPTVSSTSPDNEDVDVPVNTNITVAFSEPVNKLSVKGNITISPETGIETYSWSEDNKTLTLILSSGLSSYTNYNVTINTNVKDLSQNSLQNPYNFSFRTKDVALPDANAGLDKEVNEDVETELNASLSGDNVGIVNWTWSFVEEGKNIDLYGETVYHIFTQPGLYVITLNVSDSAGNWAVDILNITVKDITPPVITILSPMNNTITNQDITLVYFIYDNVDDIENITITGPDNNTVYSNEGKYTIILNATDKTGNNISKTIIFIIDKTSPTITAASSDDGLITNQNVTLSYSFSDNVSSVENITVSGDESPYTQEGSYSIILTATDQAGNNISQTITFTIDKTPPSMSDISPADGTKTEKGSIPVSGKTEPDATVKINGINVSVSPDGFFSKEITLVKGDNTITITATDRAGNTNTTTVTIERTEEKEEGLPDYLIYLITIPLVFVVALIVGIAFLKRKIKKRKIKIRCPACKTVFDVKPRKRPLKTKCPKCGIEGVLR